MKLSRFSYRNYVRYLRRQNVHVQRVHAFVFAALISGAIACTILYYDYGFWHDMYVRDGDVVHERGDVVLPAPTDSLSHFLDEVSVRWSSIGTQGKVLLEGTETIQNP